MVRKNEPTQPSPVQQHPSRMILPAMESTYYSRPHIVVDLSNTAQVMLKAIHRMASLGGHIGKNVTEVSLDKTADINFEIV